MPLNILLLEDDPSKKTRLLSFLNNNKELFSNVDTAICAVDAMKFLQKNKYDLFIADIVVPHELSGTKSENNCIALLEAIDDEVDNLIKPSYCLPISAAAHLSDSAREFFIGRPWGILEYTDTSNECLGTIEKIAKFILSSMIKPSPQACCDIFIITALIEPEFEAIENLGFEWEPLEPLDSSQMIKYGKFELDGQRFTIAAAFSSRMGPVAAAVLTVKVMNKLKPKLVIMAGICAGFPLKSKIGDVISPDITWDWQSGKYIDKNGKEAFQIAPHQVNIDDQTKNQLLLLKRDVQFWQSLSSLAIKEGVNAPELVIGPMASGSSVIADSRITDRIKDQQHKNVTGLDMETYAVFAAARACSQEIKVISLKSVSDLGDLKKNDAYQTYASNISAAAVYQFVTKFSKSLILE